MNTVIYIPGMAPSEDVVKAVGDREVAYRNATYFNAGDTEAAKLVVIADGVENADAITEAYPKVVKFADFVKGKEEKAEPEAFNPDAPLKAKAKK